MKRMANFNLENDMNSLLKFDAPLSKGPMMRWQRKMTENSMNGSLMNGSMNCSVSNTSISTSKTPMKSSSSNSSMSSGNLNKSKTPSGLTFKTPKGKKKTPGRGSKTPKTPGASGADRFIPSRNSTTMDISHYKMTHSNDQNVDPELTSPSKLHFQKAMSDNLNGDCLDKKILAFRKKAPQAPEGHLNNMRVLYSQSKTPGSSVRKTTRVIPQVPERILDAPDILDDYYLNLLDWSANNHLAVALGPAVYIWNASSGEIVQLFQMENSEEYVSSVAWIKEGNYLAVGTSGAEVQLWDVAQQKRLRTMTSQASRIGALSWNSFILSSGSRSGAIHHHDVRIAEHHVASLESHSQEVCGLKWSPDGRYLGSGGNDNVLNIWSAESTGSPLHTFTQHMAAVKALAWCPWQPSVLASGGGTADRHIRFWNCNTGVCLNSVDTKSQVCALQWSTHYKELISSHGFAQNQLTIWKYPTMTKVTELEGHTARVLHMAMSPDGTTVVSAAADETLRLWKCFAVDQEKKTKGTKTIATKPNSLLSLRRL
ncbi:cell division cycle protein 20 homolog [Lineus longissimus]|uniref:cell division cycle protein 20 homolog n=1 Tax=Lineus longissimus TaxID=88925 RepID=UPI002B4D0EA7